MNIITINDLSKKEIINVCDGSRIGYPCDYEFDIRCANIIGIIIEKGSGFLGLIPGERVVIPWCNVECIGEDAILVRFASDELEKLKKRPKKM
jgi:YlmC/YmxH family sporulation protein